MKISILPIFLFLGILAAQPMPPQNLILEIQLNALYLQWEPPPETQVDTYTIYRDGLELNSVDDTNYYDGDTIHDVEYCYTVTTVNPEGESEPSNMVCGAWILNPPENLRATPTDHSIILSWTLPAEPNDMLFSISVFRDDINLVDLSPTYTSYEDLPLEADTEYCYYLVTNYDEGMSEPTEYVCAMLELPAPENFTVQYSLNGLHLQWDHTIPPEYWFIEYQIYRNEEIYDTSENSIYDDDNIEYGNTYCYAVSAVYETGESDITEAICIDFQLLPPTNFNAVSEDDHIRLTWDAPDPFYGWYQGVNIFRDGYFLDFTEEYLTFYDDFQVADSDIYCYTLEAIYDEGTSELTEEICIVHTEPNLITLQGTVVYVPNLMECTCNEFILEGDPGYPSLAIGTDILGVVLGLQHLGQHLQITGEESFFQCYDAINEWPCGQQPAITLDEVLIMGCMDPYASNYNSNADIDDDSCLYDFEISLSMNAADPYYFDETWNASIHVTGFVVFSEIEFTILDESELLTLTDIESSLENTFTIENIDDSESVNIQFDHPVVIEDLSDLCTLVFEFNGEDSLGDSLFVGVDPVIPEVVISSVTSQVNRITSPIRADLETVEAIAGEYVSRDLWITCDFPLTEIGDEDWFLSYRHFSGTLPLYLWHPFTTDYSWYTTTDSSFMIGADFYHYVNWFPPDTSSFQFGTLDFGPVAEEAVGSTYIYDGLGAITIGGYNYDIDQFNSSVTVVTGHYGCTDPEASNYNPDANIDDDSCVYYDSGDMQVLQDIVDLNDLDINPLDLGVLIWVDDRLVELHISAWVTQLPESLGGLTNLEVLNCQDPDQGVGYLTGLPESIGDLVNLRSMNFY